MADNTAPVTMVYRATGVVTDYTADNFPAGTLLVLETPGQIWLRTTVGTTATWTFVESLNAASLLTRAVASTTAVADTTPAIAGQFDFGPAYVRSGLVLRLHLVLSVSAGTATVQLRNLTTATLVEIGGAGITTLTTTSATPVVVASVNLQSGTVVGFPLGSTDLYQVEVHSDDPTHAAVLGLAELSWSLT